MPRPMFSRSEETTRLIEFFQNLSLKTPVSWEEASKAIGLKVTRKSSAYDTARKRVTKDHNIVIETLYCYGFERTDAVGISSRINKGFKRIRRGAKWHAREAVVGMESTNDRNTVLILDEQFKRARLLADISQPVKSNWRKSEMPEMVKEPDTRAVIKSLPID